MKSMSLEEFLKMLKEDNSSNCEEFMQKLLDKAETKEDEELKKLKRIKQNLHKTIDAIETKKELQYFCWEMGTIVFTYFKEKVIGDDE